MRQQPPWHAEGRVSFMGAIPCSCRMMTGRSLSLIRFQPDSITRGLVPSIHSCIKAGRVEYYSVTDQEALDAALELTRLEGIIPALETAHALAILGKFETGKDDVHGGKSFGTRGQGYGNLYKSFRE